MVHGVDDAAGAEEEEGLEPSVGEDMEEACRKPRGAEAEEHVAQLGDGGVGQHLLDIALHQADAGGKEGGGSTHPGDDVHGDGGQGEHRRQAADHVDAAGDHGGRVDEGADRGRARHGVRQPEVEGQLGALARGAHEEHQGGEGQHAEAHLGGNMPRLGEDVRDREGSEGGEQGHHADGHAQVTHPVGEEGLEAGVRCEVRLEEVADEQVGAETHALPAHKHQHQAGAQHQGQHEEHEQVQVAEEAAVALVFVHVAHGVEVDQEADAGDDEHHGAAEGIDHQAEGHAQRSGGHPLAVVEHQAVVGGGLHGQEGGDSQEEGAEDDTQAHEGGGTLAGTLAQQAIEGRTHQGEDRNEPVILVHRILTASGWRPGPSPWWTGGGRGR